MNDSYETKGDATGEKTPVGTDDASVGTGKNVEDNTRKKAGWVKLGKKLLYLGVVVGILVIVAPKIFSWRTLLDAFANLSWWQYLVLTGLVLIGLLPRWYAQCKLLPGLSLKNSAWSDLNATAAYNALPGGGPISLAVYWTMWRHWVKDDETIAAALTVASILGTLARMTMPLLAVLALVLSREPLDGVGEIAGAAGVVFLLLLGLLITLTKSEKLPEIAARVVKKPVNWIWAKRHKPAPDVEKELRRVKAHMEEDTRRAWGVFGLLLLQQLWLIVLLSVCLYMVGVPGVAVSALFGAFAVERLAGVSQATPGGVGVAEVTMGAALVGRMPETDSGKILAGVVLYRAAAWGIPIVLGGIGAITWEIRLRYMKPKNTDTLETGATRQNDVAAGTGTARVEISHIEISHIES